MSAHHMRTSDEGIVALMIHEGVVPAPYRDSVGVWTFGIGHTAAAGAPDPAQMKRGMPHDMNRALLQVFDLFREDLEKYEDAVNRAIKVKVAQTQFDAAVSFHFNTGAIRRASWVKYLNDGNVRAAAKAIMNWKKPAAIIPRRRSEQKLFRDGKYPTGNINVWAADGNGKINWSKPALQIKHGDAIIMLGRDPHKGSKPSKTPKGLTALIGAALAAAAALASGLGCKIPWLADILNLNCGG